MYWSPLYFQIQCVSFSWPEKKCVFLHSLLTSVVLYFFLNTEVHLVGFARRVRQAKSQSTSHRLIVCAFLVKSNIFLSFNCHCYLVHILLTRFDWYYGALWFRTAWFWDIEIPNFQQAWEWMSAAERKQFRASKWMSSMRERMDKQEAQYSRPEFWLIWTTVRWYKRPDLMVWVCLSRPFYLFHCFISLTTDNPSER